MLTERASSTYADILQSVPVLGFLTVTVTAARVTRPFGLAEHPLQRPALRARTGDVFFAGGVTVVVLYAAWRALDYLQRHGGLGQFGPAFLYGLATFGGWWCCSSWPASSGCRSGCGSA